MGVAEHGFDVNMHGKTVTWHIYDVGGARGQRHTWVPYFDDANAIIFVAPISAFDQVSFLSCPFPTPADIILVPNWSFRRRQLIPLEKNVFFTLTADEHCHNNHDVALVTETPRQPSYIAMSRAAFRSPPWFPI